MQLINFYHASGYLQAAAEVAFPQAHDQVPRQQWLQDRCHRLKHEPGAAQSLREDMQALLTTALNTSQHEQWQSAITYFANHHPQLEPLRAGEESAYDHL